MRLIDADKLIEDIEKLNLELFEEFKYAAAVKKTIKEHPVAYNVDKVVEQLEEARQFIAKNEYCKLINLSVDCNDRDCFLCCADYLIDIVKRGGTDDISIGN